MLEIKEYWQLEDMAEDEAKTNASIQGRIKDYFDYYMFKTEPYYGLCLLVYLNGKQIYNDSQLHYPSYKDDEIADKLLNVAKYKLYTSNELCSSLKDYYDYTNRERYLRDNYIKKFNYISAFYMSDEEEERSKSYYFSPDCYCFFKTMDDWKDYHKLYKAIQERYDEVKDRLDFFEDAVRYEFMNYEVVIGERFDEALEAAGYDINKLTNEQDEICKKVYKKLCEESVW